MRLKELTFVLVRLLAVYIFIRGLVYLSNVVQFAWTSLADTSAASLTLMWALSLLPGVLFIGISLLLWKKAGAAAARMTGDKEAAAADWSAIKNSDLYRLGFILAGIVIIILTLPELISNIAQLFQVKAIDYVVYKPFLISAWSEIAVSVLKLILAFFLITNTDVIYRWVRRNIQQVKENNQ
ncbi:MAG: hypothetical protein ACE3L7_08215 [Candidatus Pristimantibacillus sp.]